MPTTGGKKRRQVKKRVGGYHFSDPKEISGFLFGQRKQVAVVGDKDGGGGWPRKVSMVTIHKCKWTTMAIDRRRDRTQKKVTLLIFVQGHKISKSDSLTKEE